MAISLIFYKYLFFIIYMVILFKKGLKIMKPTINDLYNITLEINNCFNYLFKNILKDNNKLPNEIYNYLSAIKDLSADLKNDFDDFMHDIIN